MLQKIVDFYKKNNYPLATKKNEVNICYIEGCNSDFTLNDDRSNYFNDLRLLFTFFDGNPIVLGRWEATTEPGSFYTKNPLNPKGAARIKFGYYVAWKVGIHKDHEALIQVKPVSVYRDFNKDGVRTGDAIDTGLFGINQHWGGDNPFSDVGKWSAGCLVGRTKKGQREFMALVKSDPRYRADRNFVFPTAILQPEDLGFRLKT